MKNNQCHSDPINPSNWLNTLLALNNRQKPTFLLIELPWLDYLIWGLTVVFKTFWKLVIILLLRKSLSCSSQIKLSCTVNTILLLVKKSRTIPNAISLSRHINCNPTAFLQKYCPRNGYFDIICWTTCGTTVSVFNLNSFCIYWFAICDCICPIVTVSYTVLSLHVLSLFLPLKQLIQISNLN